MQEWAKADRQDEKDDRHTQRWDESREASSHVVYPPGDRKRHYTLKRSLSRKSRDLTSVTFFGVFRYDSSHIWANPGGSSVEEWRNHAASQSRR